MYMKICQILEEACSKSVGEKAINMHYFGPCLLMTEKGSVQPYIKQAHVTQVIANLLYLIFIKDASQNIDANDVNKLTVKYFISEIP